MCGLTKLGHSVITVGVTPHSQKYKPQQTEFSILTV